MREATCTHTGDLAQRENFERCPAMLAWLRMLNAHFAIASSAASYAFEIVRELFNLRVRREHARHLPSLHPCLTPAGLVTFAALRSARERRSGSHAPA